MIGGDGVDHAFASAWHADGGVLTDPDGHDKHETSLFVSPDKGEQSIQTRC
jgi:hypothetical protein